MEIILKKEKNLFETKNIISFIFNVEFNKDKNGFLDFDIGNTEEIINDILNEIDEKWYISLNTKNSLYYSLSLKLFTNLKSLKKIEIENSRFLSKISREDIFSN